jgi:hypothetical protein
VAAGGYGWPLSLALDIGVFPCQRGGYVRDIGPSYDLANDLDRLIFCHR